MPTDNEADTPVLRKRSALLASIGALILSLTLLFLPPGIKQRLSGFGRLFTSPAQSLSAACTRATRAALGNLEENDNQLLQQLQELAQTKAELESLKNATASQQQELRILRNRIGMANSTQLLSLALCEVLARDPLTTYYDHLIINRGRNDGIKVGFPVINESGLIGIITETAQDTAKVLLATSRDFTMPCQVRSRGVNGLLMGEGAIPQGISMALPVPEIRVSRLDGVLFDKVAPGDLVTAHTSSLPDSPSIIVGTVESLEAATSGAPIARLHPAASFQNLRYLFVAIDAKNQGNGK